MLSEKGDGGLFVFQLVTILKSIFFSHGNKKKLTKWSHICSASFCYGAFISAANAAEEGERKAVYKQDAVTLTQCRQHCRLNICSYIGWIDKYYIYIHICTYLQTGCSHFDTVLFMTRHLVSVSVMIFGSCHLILLFVNSTNISTNRMLSLRRTAFSSWDLFFSVGQPLAMEILEEISRKRREDEIWKSLGLKLALHS